MLNTLSSVSVREYRIQYLRDPQWFRDTASRGPTTIAASESQFRTCPSDHDSIGYPRMSASGESSTTMHRLLHASGSHPIPPPDDPKKHCDVLSMQIDSDLVIYRTTLIRTFQVVTICRVDKSEFASTTLTQAPKGAAPPPKTSPRPRRLPRAAARRPTRRPSLIDQTCSDQFFEEDPSVLISSGLLVQDDEGVSLPVVDLIDESTAAYREEPVSLRFWLEPGACRQQDGIRIRHRYQTMVSEPGSDTSIHRCHIASSLYFSDRINQRKKIIRAWPPAAAVCGGLSPPLACVREVARMVSLEVARWPHNCCTMAGRETCTAPRTGCAIEWAGRAPLCTSPGSDLRCPCDRRAWRPRGWPMICAWLRGWWTTICCLPCTWWRDRHATGCALVAQHHGRCFTRWLDVACWRPPPQSGDDLRQIIATAEFCF
ncbi:hypothetical protein F511_17621 [Dorcoceras hygrometricum]|uniref:Uncharacterized protein n=1 Tax=Dorcoceras hygrometricum TaxID=472368 RepID=A0A2Z7CBN7_9LAMI|nr:hypothetical protein F511_17621 [Dorcoceras hygrometricum]